MPVLADPPAPFRFSTDNASQYGQLGNEIRWHSPKPDQPAKLQRIANPSDDYALNRLARVRAQLDALDLKMIEEAESGADSKTLKELADASARLSAQEFALAGRPMPGTKRPAPEGGRGARSRADASLLIEDMPAAQVLPPSPAKPLGWEYDDPNAAPSSITPTTDDRLPGDVTP